MNNIIWCLDHGRWLDYGRCDNVYLISYYISFARVSKIYFFKEKYEE